MYIEQLIKRLLGFYQTPCTILDGVQYSWPIPLDVRETIINKPAVCLGSLGVLVWLGVVDRPLHRDIPNWLTVIDHPCHDVTTPNTQTGGGTSREESE